MCADLAMCCSEDCPKRTACRRHKASGTRPDLRWQAFGAFEWTSAGCAGYWPLHADPAPRPTLPDEDWLREIAGE